VSEKKTDSNLLHYPFGLPKALFKTPNRTHSDIGVVLIVVVLVAIVEVLVPRVVAIVLRRAPVVVVSKTTHNVL
jgi:hypothetical protein